MVLVSSLMYWRLWQHMEVYTSTSNLPNKNDVHIVPQNLIIYTPILTRGRTVLCRRTTVLW